MVKSHVKVVLRTRPTAKFAEDNIKILADRQVRLRYSWAGRYVHVIWTLVFDQSLSLLTTFVYCFVTQSIQMNLKNKRGVGVVNHPQESFQVRVLSPNAFTDASL
jgi:hypothetical protein